MQRNLEIRDPLIQEITVREAPFGGGTILQGEDLQVATVMDQSSVSVSYALSPESAAAQTTMDTGSVSVSYALTTQEISAPTVMGGGVVIPFRPLLENLQLFLDYENWTAGDPLPNRYPDNSGITSLADNNTVGEETTSPLVGAKSGDYVQSNTEYHSTPNQGFMESPPKWYVSAWVSLESSSSPFPAFFAHGQGGGGYRVGYLLSRGNWRLLTDGNSIQVDDGDPSQKRFVEAYYDGTDLVLRVDNGGVGETRVTTAKHPAMSTPLVVGASSDFRDPWNGRIDAVAYEVASSGDLEWPAASTWLYNGGAGRSWSEIQNYNP